MSEKMDALYHNGTWSLVPRVQNTNVVDYKWVYRLKTDPNGQITGYKACLVAKGFHQQPRVDYHETFSPVVKPATIRTILSLAVTQKWPLRQLDVQNAFLHGDLQETVYMKQPPGFVDPTKPDHVCLLHKSLYGLKQAPRAWFTRLSIALQQLGFSGSRTDPSLFILNSNGTIVYVLVYENRMKTHKFSLEGVKQGTNNFSDDKCIFKGEHEMLYEGTIDQDPNGLANVLVKRFTNQEHGFLKEFEFVFKYKHENVLGLVGYSKEMDERIIVYEDASKGCLDSYLDDTSFTWIQRLKVCIDIARGLKFLHEGDVGQDVVIHRDIKSSNILLTMDWKAKIYGFKDAPNDDVVGLSACLDPSYYNKKDLTKESDIYSFGLVFFEILFGRMVFPQEKSGNKRMLDYLVKSVKSQSTRVEELVFEELKKHIVQKSFTIFRRIAIQCLHEKREERPTAGDVLEELQKALKFQEDYEERKAKLNSIYKKILDKVPISDKVSIYNILSEELLHEDDKLEYYPSKTVDEDYHSEPNDEDVEM
ncbi:hypothetical protein E3N88_28546 [Mikania micrantha]|uniref:Protein kinase domain-containing protein n=1 Tax=Mikania micrantha TaxID=192012 RepID=A0A5N6N2L7_9ASTR|nr:hypothetical protein E3N88_28546 [Mikania micrantha]